MSSTGVAFVTGATGGLGSIIVDRLLRENFAVFMFAQNETKLIKLFHEMRDKYPMTLLYYLGGSVTSELDVQDAIDKTESIMGPVDFLINCHGAPLNIRPAISLSFEDFRDIIWTDLIGTFNVCKMVGKGMVKNRRGCIVNISSIHSVASYPGRSAYASAKAGVVGLSRVLALEFAQHNITVNCISPGTCDVERTQNANGHQMQDLLRRIPSKKLVDPKDVASLVLSLYNNKSLMAQNIIIDGGHTASAWFMDY